MAQNLVLLLQKHPWFEISALVGVSSKEAGRKYGESIRKWYWDEPLPQEAAEMPLLPPNTEEVKKTGAKLILAMTHPHFYQIELEFAKAGFPVACESRAHRHEGDIPVLVPEINPEHLNIIETQRKNRNWKGMLVTGPVCTVTILSMSLKPIQDLYGIDSLFVVTMQGLSGAGYDGVPSLAIVDNLLPFIADEENKVEKETAKIFGTVDNGAHIIRPSPMQISSSCNRVNVSNGHTECVFVNTTKQVDINETIEAFRSFTGEPQKLGLPSAPKNPILVRMEDDRPQPRLDRAAGKGMSVTVGRVRADPIFKNGLKYVITGHNNVRGTAGNVLLCGELLYKKGFVE